LLAEAATAQQAAGSVPMTELLRESLRGVRDADFRLEVLRERADDEQVRSDVERLQRLATALAMRPPGWYRQQPLDAPDPFDEMTETHRRLNRRAGDILRGDARVPAPWWKVWSGH
jgi:hypothetical protein